MPEPRKHSVWKTVIPPTVTLIIGMLTPVGDFLQWVDPSAKTFEAVYRRFFPEHVPITELLILKNAAETTEWLDTNSMPEARSSLKSNLGVDLESFTNIADYFGSANPLPHDPVNATGSFKAWAKFTYDESELDRYSSFEQQFVPDFVELLAQEEIEKVFIFPITDGLGGEMKGKVMFVKLEDEWKIANISTHPEMLSGW